MLSFRYDELMWKKATFASSMDVQWQLDIFTVLQYSLDIFMIPVFAYVVDLWCPWNIFFRVSNRVSKTCQKIFSIRLFPQGEGFSQGEVWAPTGPIPALRNLTPALAVHASGSWPMDLAALRLDHGSRVSFRRG